MNQREADKLREEYPNFVPLKVAADYLGMSPRKLSELIAAGRKPYADLGGNICPVVSRPAGAKSV